MAKVVNCGHVEHTVIAVVLTKMVIPFSLHESLHTVLERDGQGLISTRKNGRFCACTVTTVTPAKPPLRVWRRQ